MSAAHAATARPVSRMSAISLLAVMALALVGCASAPQPVRSPKEEVAAEANQRARRLFLQGDYAGALSSAGRAYESAAAIEDEAGLAASLLNLSVIYHHLGRDDDAGRALDRILTSPGLRFAPQRLAEAALQRAVIALSIGQRQSAAEWLARSTTDCGQPCPLEGRLLNVRAEIAILDNRLGEALQAARRAEDLNRGMGSDEDLATSHRLAANVHIHQAAFDDARRHLDVALTIDKRLGISRRIFGDLLLSGIAAERAGEHATARSFYQRARDVALADRHDPGIKDVETRLQRLPPAK